MEGKTARIAIYGGFVPEKSAPTPGVLLSMKVEN
jgi:hypothetical protein